MKSFFFIVSRVSHIATARAIANKFPNAKKTIVIIGGFSGDKKAQLAAKIDLIWDKVIVETNLINYLNEYSHKQSEIFLYTDFGFRINFHLYFIHKKNRIHIFQDGSASYIKAKRKFSFLNYLYSLFMGYGFRSDNFVGQSKFISSLYLYQVKKFRNNFDYLNRSKFIELKEIHEDFLESIGTLADNAYFEKFVYTGEYLDGFAVLYLPGWSVKLNFLNYIQNNYDSLMFIKPHPADQDTILGNNSFIRIEPYFVAEQVIIELQKKFKKIKVFLESEATSYNFLNSNEIEFYLLSSSTRKEITITKI